MSHIFNSIPERDGLLPVSIKCSNNLLGDINNWNIYRYEYSKTIIGYVKLYCDNQLKVSFQQLPPLGYCKNIILQKTMVYFAKNIKNRE